VQNFGITVRVPAAYIDIALSRVTAYNHEHIRYVHYGFPRQVTRDLTKEQQWSLVVALSETSVAHARLSITVAQNELSHHGSTDLRETTDKP
jgi:hypothetical protein